MAETIAAVVVTFNRKQLLTECLDGLLRQSLPPDAIFIVDNASSDGTDAFLQELGYLDRPGIHYLRLATNGGGAGGFFAGMRAAFEAGFEWIWLMDDDTEPESDALEQMEPLKHYTNVVAIANRKVDVHGNDTRDGLRLLPATQGVAAPYPLVKFSSFVGILIRSATVQEIGLPRPEFFIHNDDLEYCLRLRKVGHIAFAPNSRVIHKEQARPVQPRKVLGFSYLPTDLYGYCFEYFGHRNYVVAQRTHGTPVSRILLPLRHFVLASGTVLLFSNRDHVQRFRILLRAFRDGLRSNFDNTYPFRMREHLKLQKK